MKYLVSSLLALPLLISCVDDGYNHHDYYAPSRAQVHRHYPNDHYHPQQRYYNQAPRVYGHPPVAQAYVQQHGRPPVAQAQVQQHGNGAPNNHVAQHPNSNAPVAAPPVAVHEQTSAPQPQQPRVTPPQPADVKEEGQGTTHGHP